MRGCSGGGVRSCSRGVCMVAPGGRAWLFLGGHAWDTTRYGDTVNERAVHILLECILVDTVDIAVIFVLPIPVTLLLTFFLPQQIKSNNSFLNLDPTIQYIIEFMP